MTIAGKQLINGEWVDGRGGTYQAIDPSTGAKLDPVLTMASAEQVTCAVVAAQEASSAFRHASLDKRASFLRACADEIMALGDTLVLRAMAESGLPRVRIEGERGRTCGQLNLFADTVLEGTFLDVRIDTALPDRQPFPRPDLRYMNQAIGPVVVFGASNFPLAFSAAGGDTASAFAAGCPVLVKGHSSHPGTCELVAQAIDKAVKSSGLPAGVFSLLMGSGREVGAALVVAPEVKAVGFTGSFGGGMALVELAAKRKEPIPVFAEMGSINPVVLLPETLAANAEKIAEGFVGSLNMGVGQFCTNPGLVLAIEGEAMNRFINRAADCLAQLPAGVMLNEGIQQAYDKNVVAIASQYGVEKKAIGKDRGDNPGFCGQPTLLTVSAADFIANPELTEEMFGPAALVVKCRDLGEMESAVKGLRGQLTATIHAAEGEMSGYSELIDLLTQRVGRILVNGFPTGVEVCHSMVHSGPFPACTDARFTSVGTAAMNRFLRPVCLQNYPKELLPEPLQDNNPLTIWRLVNGKLSKEML
ncbi:aldehyde dehydrogenase (NADP(+)) [Geopsychrobacter electrodiphilus]|uniref:aldehyde dehydrogenase (NADP(+)) n=1 Tax=Geopsychrobacter electrodiphilus TaxID=225196 RepID=UPI000376348C|nr:aldehyde dehydrogenase (NADP(+)) [Geopsychrobacter electrodiphilus]